MERKMGLSSRARLFERLLAPRIPVHRIVGVLLQVRALLADQMIGQCAHSPSVTDRRLERLSVAGTADAHIAMSGIRQRP